MKAMRKIIISGILISMLIFSLFGTMQSANAACSGTVYVNAASGSGSPNGCSWGTAFPKLQDALAIAASGDQIWVAAGTYYPDEGTGQTNNARSSTFTLKSGVAIYGGFAGTETLLSQRNANPATNNTVLSGDIDGTPGDNSANAYHVVTASNLTASAILDGFTVSGGNTSGAGNPVGGGMLLTDSSLTLANLIVQNNNSSSNGGGIYLYTTNPAVPELSYSRPVLTNVAIRNNTAAEGGGIYARNASPVLNNMVITGNNATGGAGGGMHSTTANANDAPAVPKLTDVTFSGNSARGGAGLYNYNSSSVLNNVTFNGNTALRRGGAMLNEFANPSLTNVTLYGNVSNETVGTTPWGGGAIMNLTSNPVLNNVTFSGNNSVNGSGTAGGDAMRNASNSNPVIRNSILWADLNEEIVTDAGSTVTLVDSVVQGGCPALGNCTNLKTTTPNLGALANNGGFTQTMAISAGSSALNAGGVNFACAPTDQRGISRPQGSACDIGAFELDSAGVPVTINQAAGQADPTNSSPINFTVVFSEAVTGFATGDVTLTGSAGATTATITESAPNNGTTYNVAVSGMTSDGTIIVSVPAGVALNGSSVPNNASSSTDNTVTYDTTRPSVTVNQAAGQADPTSASPINFTVVFSEPINASTFTTGDITQNGTATGITWSIANSGDDRTFTLSATAVTGDGTLVPSIAAGAVQDPATNTNTASSSTDNSVLYDITKPTVTVNQAAGQADPTNTSPINFTVVFSEAVTGFATGDITPTGTAGATTAAISEIAPNNGTTYNVAVSGMTGDGTIIVTVPAGVATDASNNGNTASTSTDNTVTYDTAKPSVTVNQAAGQADPTNALPINFTVVFSEVINPGTFTTADITQNGSATGITWSITNSGDNRTFTLSATAVTGAGTLVPSIAAGVVQDPASNTNTLSTSMDNSVTYNPVGPTVTVNQAAGQADPTNTSPINFTVVFSEAVTGFATGDITPTGSAGATTAAISEIAPNNGTTYNVAVSGMTSDGAIIVSVPAGVAVSGSSIPNNPSSSTDNTVTYDTTGPTVTINQAAGQVDPTSASPVNFDVVFSEDVSGFTGGNITLSGTASATTAVVTGSGKTYTVAVTGMTGNGTVIASIGAGAVKDNAGNGNSPSTSTDNSVTFNSNGPTVTINQTSGQADPTSVSPINFTVVFGESVIGFATGDVAISGTAGATTATVTEIAPNNGTTFNVAVSGMSSSGTVIAAIPAGKAQNTMGNGNQASTSTDNAVTFDLGYPTVSTSSPSNNGTVSPGPTKLTVQFSEDVKNDGSSAAANNTANYLLIEKGTNNVFDTLSCASGVLADDTQITVNSAAYTNNGGRGPFVATLNINSAAALPIGNYRLFVCGTTSIEDLANNKLNNGLSDSTVSFSVTVQAQTRKSTVLPKTGFAMNQLTVLPAQPANKAYASTDLLLEIPRLSVKMSIVGVPFSDGSWDVSWLDKSAGWLSGSAFPTWNGNSVLTGHVWDALNRPGPFAGLKDLKYGDQVKIHAFGQVFTYEVRESTLISPTDTTTVLAHKDKSWITLVTCENYKERTQEYLYRRMVRAVLVNVAAEK